MEAISQIGNPTGRTTSEQTHSGKNLESYRRHPTTKASGDVQRVDATVTSRQPTQPAQNEQNAQRTSSPSFFSDVLQDITTRTEQNNFFRLGSRCSNCDEDERNSSGSLLNKSNRDSNFAITSGQSDAALGRANGVFSQGFVDANPAFSPPPRELPNDVKASSGELSQDLLQALQRYRIAAEIQG